MKNLEKLIEFLENQYTYKSKLPTEKDIIKDYIAKVQDPYLKYVDDTNHFMNVFDVMGIRIKNIANVMGEIIDFFDEKIENLKIGDVILSVNGMNPFDLDVVKLIQSLDTIHIVAVRNLYKSTPCIIIAEYPNQQINMANKQISVITDEVSSVYYLKLLDCNSVLDSYLRDSYQYNYFILDLRDNLGGSVKNIYDALSILCRDGQVAYAKEDCWNQKKVMKVHNNVNCHKHKKIIVIINRHTMSSAELLAISLRDNNDASIIGEQSYGKAVMTAQYKIDDECCIMVPKYIFLSPKGENINHKGITPNFTCDEETIENMIQSGQLKKIITYINNLERSSLK